MYPNHALLALGILSVLLALDASANDARGAPPLNRRAPSQLPREARDAALEVARLHRASKAPRNEFQQFARVLRQTEALLLELTRPVDDGAAPLQKLVDRRNDLQRSRAAVERGSQHQRRRRELAAPFLERSSRLVAALDEILANPDPIERSKAASALVIDLRAGRPDHGEPLGSPTLRSIPEAEIQRNFPPTE